MSEEALHKPSAPISGYHGDGFAETDHAARTVSSTVKIPEDGLYSISVRYANGNGPVNTENRCSIRTLKVDGKEAGTIVMPQRGTGNWNDWGMSNTVNVRLTPGTHSLSLDFLPVNENMNLKVNHALTDLIVIRRIAR